MSLSLIIACLLIFIILIITPLIVSKKEEESSKSIDEWEKIKQYGKRINEKTRSNKKNENVTASILIWGTIIILPISIIFEQPWNFTPRLDSTLSLIYLGIFPTGIAWLLRFMILKNNGVVFQSQVAFLIPIFGVILGYIFLQEIITSKVMLSLVAVVLGIYFVKKSTTSKNFWGT